MSFNRDNNKGCPCAGCKDRVVEPNCHMTCEPFLKWRQDKDDENKAKRMGEVSTMSETKKRAIWKKMRYSRQVRFNNTTKEK